MTTHEFSRRQNDTGRDKWPQHQAPMVVSLIVNVLRQGWRFFLAKNYFNILTALQ